MTTRSSIPALQHNNTSFIYIINTISTIHNIYTMGLQEFLIKDEELTGLKGKVVVLTGKCFVDEHIMKS